MCVCLLFACVLSCHALYTCHRCHLKGDMFSVAVFVELHWGCHVTCHVLVMSH